MASRLNGCLFNITDAGSNLGKLHLALCADVLHSSTSNRHINNLEKFLRKELAGRKHLILVVDNGPDWRMEHANVMSYGRLFKRLKLDRLTIVHYSPYHSRFNFIERRWGVYLLRNLVHSTRS